MISELVAESELLDRSKPFGAQVGEDMFCPPQTICAGFNAQSDSLGSAYELLFNVLRHQPAFFDFEIAALKAREIDVSAGQCDACCLLVLLEPVGIDAIDLFEIVIEPARIEGCVSKHFR